MFCSVRTLVGVDAFRLDGVGGRRVSTLDEPLMFGCVKCMLGMRTWRNATKQRTSGIKMVRKVQCFVSTQM